MTEDSNNDIKETSTETMKSIPEKEDTKDGSNSKSDIKAEEIKKLEEKEHHELDYFSKEETLEKVKNLEKEITEFRDKVQKLKKENEASKSKYMHLQAEFENAQKRWNKSQQELRTRYIASVLKNFLPLYDSFKKAIETGNQAEKNILNGFFSQFMSVFKSYGVVPIEAKINDNFDYSLHEALTSVEKGDITENSILEIIQDGFKYGKEILRYTKVVVSRKPKPPPKPEPKEEVVEDVEVEGSEIEETEIEEDPQYKKNKEKKSKKSKKDKENEKSS